MRRRESLLAVAGALGWTGVAHSAVAAQAVVGQKAPAFEVADASGRKRSLAEFAGKTVVLEWTSPSCPFVRAQYVSGKMQELQRWAAGKGVVWLSVLSTNPARADFLPGEKAAAFDKTRNAAPTALLMDSTGQLGRAYGARTTPHMFVIAGTGLVAYAGAIDSKATVDEAVVLRSKNLVRAALDDLLAGRKVATPKTAPYGCAVGYEA
ncbi:MAG: redoxin domain-containing protein [Polaromonas sp.]|uniref:redoxin domain-containing protein n=1 Tax=Polaromonas sp. TaxID=1869339 RepID=UPI0027338112|nr:redoxin domain-containing protein [Polaromonas sp.]MDP2819615.1 redoxin domain-containing protein [Polaromonas sp.]